jgi:hypothetical protein
MVLRRSLMASALRDFLYKGEDNIKPWRDLHPAVILS